MFGNTFDSLGALLKHFRKRSHLTQQQLATSIGMHRTTIGRWEEGSVLPESKALVLELAQHLHLDEQETRQLLEASLTALAPHWLVPLPRNLFFTGREEILKALHTQLSVERTAALTQSSALHGLGGVGKTQIALEYAYRHALEYNAVFWIGAETEEQIVSDLLHIAETLGLPGREDKDQQRAVAAVQHWLISHSQWLLIWDNVEDLALLERFLPVSRSGAILITTRCQTLGTLARGIELNPMGQEEGMLFLLRRAKGVEPETTNEQMQQSATRMPAQYTTVSELVTVLGGLPLALDQAGAYVETTRCGLSTYLELFRTRRAVLLQQRSKDTRDHPASVSTTFTLAITATAERHPAVRDLLQVCALLLPDAIPEELFRQGGAHLGMALEAVCRDPLEWNRVVGIACGYSLLSRQPEEQTLSLHQLVQAVLLDEMMEEERELWDRRVSKALEAVFPQVFADTEHTAWKRCERLLPHTLFFLHREEAAGPLVFASLASKTAQHLHVRGRYTEAEPLLLRAWQIREQVLGPEHPDGAASLHSLAEVYRERGKYAQAEPLYQRALHIREQVLGPEHLDVGASLTGLALLCWQDGKYAQAQPLFQRALRIWKQSLGPEHPRVGTSFYYQAEIYQERGLYEQAEALFQRARQTWEQALGPDHPYVAFALVGLALLSIKQSKDAQGEALCQRARQIWEQALGPDHPDVALSLTDLAEFYATQGKDKQAEALFQRACQIWEQALGPDHPHVALPLNGLANLSLKQGKNEQAERLFQRALALRERRLGLWHPETAQTLHDLALLRKIQRNLDEALSLAERALQIRAQSLGDSHPKTIATQTLSTQILQEQAAEQGREEVPASCDAESQTDEASSLLHEGTALSCLADDLLQAFLEACCERHPRAWCRSSDLWQAYGHWVEEQQEHFPLSRGAFIAQLKAHGCRAGRTMSARIWRGIALVKKEA